MAILNGFAILASAMILVLLLIFGSNLLLPIVIALFLWHLINAVADGIRKIFRCKRWISLSCSIAAMIIFFWIPLELASGSIPQLIQEAPKYQNNLEDLSHKLFVFFDVSQSEVLLQIREHLNIPSIATAFASTIATITGNLVLILLYTAFLLLDQGTFPAKIEAMFTNAPIRNRVNNVISSMNKKIKTYLFVKTFLSVLTGLFSYLVLRIVGIDFAEFWAVFIFFLNYIPTIGSFLGVICPAFLALVQFETIYPFFIIFFGCGITQFLIGNILEPKMMGNSLNLSTFVILLALTFWGTIWGIIGAFLSVPITVVLMIICSEFTATRKIAILLSGKGEISN